MTAVTEPGIVPTPAGPPRPYDEMYQAAPDGTPGPVRPAHDALARALDGIGPDDLAERANLRDAYLDRQGITFTLSGRERPLPLDLVPRIITAEEWRRVESGVAQRIRALEAFLADIYGPGEVLADGIVPRRLVTSSTHFHRDAWGIAPPNGVRIHIAGIDLIRDERGEFLVLEDNLRNPSGVSYVLENRRTLAHVIPEVFGGHRVRPVDAYPERLLEALQAAAPAGIDDPTIAVLTPGVHNAAHYEHAFLARRMGVELVEGRDLFCRDDQVWLRTTNGPQPVHVIYRRIDDEFLDPVHFRPDSLLGVPGLLNAARAGRVTIANAVGNGVADDKAVYPYVPDLIAYYLDEAPILPNVTTYNLQDPDQLAHVLDRLDRMVIKPTDGSGGYGLIIGSRATEIELAAAAKRITADPRNWIAQPIVTFSTCPTAVDGGRLVPRHVDLRPFAVNDGEHIFVLPGGLTRVALPEGSLVVNSSQGGGSKDTWVLEDDALPGGRPVPAPVPRVERVSASVVARAHAPVPLDERLRQQEGQQQQQGDPAEGSSRC
ncbi:MAG: circularly permuted type 2 ATP-grasp protein [Actinomycetota bacterium]|nr:MAG: circularly permuted type 2 ATP-grasp protein [Actinomycetota bacterium]